MKILLAATLSLALAGVAAAQTPAPAAPAAPAAAPAGKLTADSTLEALLANPKSHAILEKHLEIIVQYADMIPPGTFTELSARANQVARLLSGYIAYLDKDDPKAR